MSGHERGSRTEEEEEEEEERRRSCVIKAEKTRQLLSAWRERRAECRLLTARLNALKLQVMCVILPLCVNKSRS